jgi:uncharacterized protein DUF4383
MSLMELTAAEGSASRAGIHSHASFARVQRLDHHLRRSPAQNYALVIGASLSLAGIVGFFYSGSFGKPGEVDAVFGVLDVNGWHNVVHLLTGLLGLATARSYSAARRYAIGLGVVYAAVAIWGFAIGDGESILGIVPVNSEDNALHVLIALAGLGAGLGTPAVPSPSTVSAQPGPGFRFD